MYGDVKQGLAHRVKSEVLEWLKGTPYAASDLEPLPGGSANFVYRASLINPLEDGTSEVLVKHGEPFVATDPNSPLTTDRCRVEEVCLKALNSAELGKDEASGDDGGFKFVVRTPKCLMYDDATRTQVQEYLTNGTTLKAYTMKNYSSPTSESLRPQCHRLGKVLAYWVLGFHRKTARDIEEWSRDKEGKTEPSLYAGIKGNRELQALKHMINYGWMLERVDQFPDILGESREVFKQVKAHAAAELKKGDLMPIQGDFWTGNTILPDTRLEPDVEVPVFIIDWEMCQLGVPSMDHGQMLGEMYQLWVYKKIDAGLWMVQGYAEGVAERDEAAAWRTAVQLGCHLLCFGTVVPGWGTPEQVREIAKIGRDIVVNSWNRNREWMENSDLKCLFEHVVWDKEG